MPPSTAIESQTPSVVHRHQAASSIAAPPPLLPAAGRRR
uniref:Uncharacterized protein n=1 Tax=Setaria italica TaxID=4555 RepID=K3Z1I5_SETIT